MFVDSFLLLALLSYLKEIVVIIANAVTRISIICIGLLYRICDVSLKLIVDQYSSALSLFTRLKLLQEPAPPPQDNGILIQPYDCGERPPPIHELTFSQLFWYNDNGPPLFY